MVDIARVSRGGTQFQFALLDDCSVSDHLRQTEEFYELEFLEGLESLLQPSTLVLDVGAHIGNHTVFFAGVLGLRVLAYEPNPEAFTLLEQNVRMNGLEELVTCFPAALSSRAGHVTMARTVADDAGTMAVAEDSDSSDVIRVETHRLDDLDLPDAPAVYLKLDVEGHETAVLRGGERFLTERRPDVSVEIQDVEALDAIGDVIGPGYVAADVFNPTPTVLFRSADSFSPDVRQGHLVRYAVRNALAYGQRRNWYIAEKRRADRFRAEAEKLSEKVGELRLGQRLLGALGPWLEETQESGLQKWLEDLRASRASETATGVRALIVRIGGPPIPASVVSLVMAAVDLVDCDPESGQTTRFRRFIDGRCVLDRAERFGVGELGAARVSLLVEAGNSQLGPVNAAALVGGEASPRVEEAFRNFLECPYMVVSHDPSYHFSRLSVLAGASRIFVSDPDEIEVWSRSQILPAEAIDVSPMKIAEHLAEVRRDELGVPVQQDGGSSEGEPRVLLVSYYAPPATPVSVQRLAYWHRMLPEIASSVGGRMDVSWLTATYGAHRLPHVTVVPDRGPYEATGRWFELYARAKDVGLDAMGISWSYHVERAIHSLGGPYSTVVISGNPFQYFALGEVFKEAWGSKVILDFRDPFAYNPRFKFTVEQRDLAKELESSWVEQADAVVSVNQYCLDSVAPHVDTPRYVVANGFDEAIVSDSVPSAREDHRPLRITYSGTVFPNLPLGSVLDALPTGRLELHHFGRDYSASQDVAKHRNAVARGLVPYSELMSELRECVAGIIMTSGEPSTQTTKLFDYLACDLDIIIVTSGRLRTGNLHEMTKDLEGVFWVKNEERDLRRFFGHYQPTLVSRPERESFSRREQTRRLFDLIMELEES